MDVLRKLIAPFHTYTHTKTLELKFFFISQTLTTYRFPMFFEIFFCKGVAKSKNPF